jgi:hypothetical protein
MQGKKEKYPMAGVGEKPPALRVTLSNGTVRLVGISRAADWLGCSHQALGQLVRGKPGCALNGPLAKKAREHYPELFTETTKWSQ